MFLKVLHALGLTNLSDDQVRRYEELKDRQESGYVLIAGSRLAFFKVGGMVLVVAAAYLLMDIGEDTLIEHVSIKAIIADTRVFADKVGDTNYIPPAPWHTRFKIALNGKILDELSPNRNSRFDTSLFSFDGTLIDFRGSTLDTIIAGSHFTTLSQNTLQADFDIPRIIQNWNFDEDPVVMIVRVTTVDDKKMTEKTGFFLVSLPFLTSQESTEGQKQINEAMYEGENSFTGDFVGGNTTYGLTNGTVIDDE